MSRRSLPIERLPGWPLFLTLSLAAAYVGASPGVFTAEVKAGIWPKPRLRGAKGGLATWDRREIDAISQNNVALTSPAAPPLQPEESEQEFKGRFIGKTAQRGTKASRKAA